MTHNVFSKASTTGPEPKSLGCFFWGWWGGVAGESSLLGAFQIPQPRPCHSASSKTPQSKERRLPERKTDREHRLGSGETLTIAGKWVRMLNRFCLLGTELSIILQVLGTLRKVAYLVYRLREDTESHVPHKHTDCCTNTGFLLLQTIPHHGAHTDIRMRHHQYKN